MHIDTVHKKHARNCEDSEDQVVTTDKGVALQCGHGENHARAAEKSRKLRGGGGCVCTVHVCVSGYAVCC